jgi:AraC family transcriptional regulator
MEELATLSDGLLEGFLGISNNYNPDNQTFDYYIAVCTNQENNKFETIEIPETTWAIFEIRGKISEVFQKELGRIFNEWLPESGFEHAMSAEIEWYPPGDRNAEDYLSEFWLPIKGSGKS